MNAINYLDSAKIKLGGISDYALAKKLGRGPSWISRFRCGSGHAFDDRAAIEIASILEIDPLIVIADMHLERPKENREFWEGVKQKAGHAAVIVSLVFGFMFPLDSKVYASQIAETATGGNMYYARLVKLLERLFRISKQSRTNVYA